MQEATTTLLDITVIFFKQKTCLVAKQRSQIGRTAVSKAIIVIQFRKNIGNYSSSYAKGQRSKLAEH